MRRKTRFVPYDYEEAYCNYLKDLDEFFVENMLKNKVKCIYATKEIRAGEQLEIAIYPEFTMLPQTISGKKSNNREAMKNLNDKNARKRLERKINANFTNGDIWMTLTYGEQPQSIDRALKDMQLYINRINYRRRKLKLSNARYIYVTEWCQDENEEVRCHHHVIMDGDMDMDICESIWKKGRRNESRRLNKDDCGLSGMAHYVTKKPRGQKRWRSSQGLKDPDVAKNHYKFKRKQVEEMVRNQSSIQEIMESTYRKYRGFKYRYIDYEIKYNDFNNLFYIYVRMRRD